MSLHILGADEAKKASDSMSKSEMLKTGLQAGGELVEELFSAIDIDKAKSKASASDQAKSDAAIAADAAASLANANALTLEGLAASATGKASVLADAKAVASKLVAANASAKQDAAGAVIPANLVEKRVTAAQQGLDDATLQLQAKPTGRYEKNLVQAWTATLAKVQHPESGKKHDPEKVIVERKMKLWEKIALGVGGASLLTGIVMVVKKAVGK